MKIKKEYYWIIGGLISLVIYAVFYIIYSLPCKGECFELLLFGLFLSIPCKIIGLKENCTSISVLIYFLLGALIGFLVYKIKNK